MIDPRRFRLVLADARGGGTRDDSLRVSAWEATYNGVRSASQTHFTL